MTRNPDGLRKLQEYFEQHIGPFWLGTVGDKRHTYGYHLGCLESSDMDYSCILPRDVAGWRKHGGYWASAVDIGMGWPGAVEWLHWLTEQALRGKFPDIREIIGSTDGSITRVWDMQSGTVGYAEEDHSTHTHISFHRDAVFKDQTAIFKGWNRNGRVKPTLAAPSPKPRVSPSPAPVEPQKASEVPYETLPVLGAALLLAWAIRRRREAGL